MRRIIVVLGIFLLLLKACVFADNSVKAEVDKTGLTTDEYLTYKITLSSVDKELTLSKLPEFDGFTVATQMQSSNISFVKNEVESTMVYIYLLIPIKTGTLIIPSFKVMIQGEEYQTDAFEIEVKQGKTMPKTTPKQKPYPPGKFLPEGDFEQPRYTL
ncbi:MAG: BatD family protein [Candidatus Omnitrophota bacterium]